MKKLAIGTAAAALALAMTSCNGGFSSDGRLFITNPTVKTEYRAPTSFVGCDRVDGVDATTVVKAELDTNGNLKKLFVQLQGQTNSLDDDNFRATFTLAAKDYSQDNDKHITVKFTADAATGKLLPASKTSGISSQGIIVTPAKITIKEVQVNSADRVNPNNQNSGFKVAVQGTSDQDATTSVLTSAATIPVYTNCTLVKVTNDEL
jgi:hypothetical protein